MENPIKIDDLGTPILGNLHIGYPVLLGIQTRWNWKLPSSHMCSKSFEYSYFATLCHA